MTRLAVGAMAAQALFPAAWLTAAGLQSGYSNDREFVSELAALDASHRWIVTLGIAALGSGWIMLGLAFASGLRGRPRVTPLCALLLVAGILTTAVALLPLDCAASVDDGCQDRVRDWQASWHHYAHGFLSWSAELLLAATPFALAWILWPHRTARTVLALGVLGSALGVALHVPQLLDESHAGIYQRAGLTVLQGWTYLLACGLILAAWLQRQPEGAAPQ